MVVNEDVVLENKKSVINSLEEYVGASPIELYLFESLIENKNKEDWTCDFKDELLPLFMKMRDTLKNQNIKNLN